MNELNNSMKKDFIEYQEEVFKYLEYLEFGKLVIEFKPEDVAKSLAGAIQILYLAGVSPRLNAIYNWSYTMNYQIIPHSKQEVKH